MNLHAHFHMKQESNLRMVFTDHSLFGFADTASVHINKALKFLLDQVDACICVSHTNKENLTLRGAIPPHKIHVIPNAVDTTKFTPDKSLVWPKDKINVVVVSRLSFRKGTDFLVDVIPDICKKHPNVHFIIGGGGEKMPLL